MMSETSKERHCPIMCDDVTYYFLREWWMKVPACEASSFPIYLLSF